MGIDGSMVKPRKVQISLTKMRTFSDSVKWFKGKQLESRVFRNI